MKKFTFRSLLAIAAAGVLFTACKDENDDGNTSKTTYEFSVKAEDNPISAPADGKTYTILVTSTKTAQAGTERSSLRSGLISRMGSGRTRTDCAGHHRRQEQFVRGPRTGQSGSQTGRKRPNGRNLEDGGRRLQCDVGRRH